MNNGMHGELALSSARACFGCVDWYPYYRHRPGVQAEVMRSPGASALAATRATARPSAPLRKPAGLPKRTDDELIHV
jgi:hypothetical protein